MMTAPLYDWRENENRILTGQKHYDQDQFVHTRLDVEVNALFPRNADATHDLTFAVRAGRIRQSDGTVVAVGAALVTLTNNTTNYVQIDDTGAWSADSARDEEKRPAYKIVTSGGAISSIVDERINFDFASGTGADGTNGAGYGGTSTTSFTLGTGSKTFTTQSGLAYVPGLRVRAIKSGDVTKWVEGAVTSYSGTTLVIESDTFMGSGTVASWVFGVAGIPGTDGVESLDELSDVNAPSPSERDILYFDGAEWVNVDPSTIGVSGYRPFTQTGNTLATAKAIRPSTTPDTFVYAKADAPANAGFAGFVITTGDTFTFAPPGSIASVFAGLVAGEYYYLSDTTAGEIVRDEPTTVGSVSRPVLYAINATTGLVLGMRASRVGLSAADRIITTSDDIDLTDVNVVINTATSTTHALPQLSAWYAQRGTDAIYLMKLGVGSATVNPYSGDTYSDLSTTESMAAGDTMALRTISDGTNLYWHDLTG